MAKEIIPFNKFKKIMETIQEFRDKQERISDFFEKEIAEDSWCLVTVGNPMVDTLVNMLADEFNCWFSWKEDDKNFNWWERDKMYGISNDIEEWLYSTDDRKSVTVNGEETDITTLENLYIYLVSEYCKKSKIENLT